MRVYELSDYGKALDYKTWRTIGGCGAPNNTMAVIRDDMTLGEIAEQCPYTGRGFARFAAERLNMTEFFKGPASH